MFGGSIPSTCNHFKSTQHKFMQRLIFLNYLILHNKDHNIYILQIKLKYNLFIKLHKEIRSIKYIISKTIKC